MHELLVEAVELFVLLNSLFVCLAGFAFVYMKDKRDADDAIHALNRFGDEQSNVAAALSGVHTWHCAFKDLHLCMAASKNMFPLRLLP